ncbi:hypothetical protein L6R50_00495 [Myxococcota bacterium]|nr:hypothetical protein [Myxococcota bacterium]
MTRILAAMLLLLLAAPALAASADVDQRYAEAYRRTLDARDRMERDPASARRDIERALVDLSGITSTDPDYAPARFGLGVAYRALGRCAEGEAEFERYLDMISRDPDLAPLSGRVERERASWPCEGESGPAATAVAGASGGSKTPAATGAGGKSTGSSRFSNDIDEESVRTSGGGAVAERSPERTAAEETPSTAPEAEPAPARRESAGDEQARSPAPAVEADRAEPARTPDGGEGERTETAARGEDPPPEPPPARAAGAEDSRRAGRGWGRSDEASSSSKRSAAASSRRSASGPSPRSLLAGGIVLNLLGLAADGAGAWFVYRGLAIQNAAAWESGLDADYGLDAIHQRNLGFTIASFVGAGVMHGTGIALMVGSGQKRRSLAAGGALIPGPDGRPFGVVHVRF